MKGILATSAFLALGAVTAMAAPLVPRITSHDFNFGAWETASVPFYDPRGADPDYLTLLPDPSDREVTAFWEIWPVGGTPLPVFNAGGLFGGDLELALQFTGNDEAPPHLDVSITGTGRNVGADLVVWGAIPAAGIPFGPLLAIDVQTASIYGYGGTSSFVLETAGTIVFMNPALPGFNQQFIGTTAVSRGNIDFLELQMPSHYNPLTRVPTMFADGGGYSGEVGPGTYIPEPASIAGLLVGLGFLARRRG